jgi:hypothetical protein
VQIPADIVDDASLDWERNQPDTPVCGLVSAEVATQFLRTTQNNPLWAAADWKPTAESLKAASAAAAAAAAPKPPTQAELAAQVADQAGAAARKGDYTAALALAQKAAAMGHPMEKDQVDYFTERSAQQERAAAETAKLKAAQQAAAATAAQIMDRQQKDYADRARKAKERAEANEPNAAVAAMGGQALGSYAQSLGTGIAQNVANGAHPTQANAVGSTSFARNQPVPVDGYRAATDCVSVGKVTINVDNSANAPATVATNKCDFKVVFQWCVEGGGDGRACPREGALPPGRDEIEAHGRLTLSQQTVGLPVRTWACEAPGAPRITSGSAFECK